MRNSSISPASNPASSRLLKDLDRPQHLRVLRPPGVRELDAHRATIARVSPADDEALLLEPVEVARERRSLDVHGPGELVLRPPLVAVEVREDEPHRHRAAHLGERVVERAPDVLGGVSEVEADRGSGRTHGAIVAF